MNKYRSIVLSSFLLFTLFGVFSTVNINAAAFTPGNLVVCRIGDGTAAPNGSATAVFLDEYTIAGVSVQSIPMPTADSAGNQILTVAGSATSECLMTRSADGQFILIAGYDAAPGTATPNTMSSANIQRVIGRVGNNGVVDTTTTTTAFSAQNFRGVASDNGTNIWMTGSGTGIVYTTFGSSGAGTIVSTTITNNRGINVFNGQLYSSDSSGAVVRLGTVGTGLPTATGQTITNLPGFPVAGSPYNFFFADLTAAVAGVDTVYVADDAAGVQKFSLVAGNWTLNGAAVAGSIRGLTGIQLAGPIVNLYGTTATGTSLVSYVDSSGYNARPTPVETKKGGGSAELVPGAPVTIAASPLNTLFRSVVLAPFLRPSAANASLSGRVMNGDGRGIARVMVTVSGGSLSQPIMALTNGFGYYSFPGLESGSTYIVTVSSKSYAFSDPSRIISLTDNISDFDFVADGNSRAFASSKIW